MAKQEAKQSGDEEQGIGLEDRLPLRQVRRGLRIPEDSRRTDVRVRNQGIQEVCAAQDEDTWDTLQNTKKEVSL